MTSPKSKCVTRVFKIQSFINFPHSKKVRILLKTGIFLSIDIILFKTFQRSWKEFIRLVSLVIWLAVCLCSNSLKYIRNTIQLICFIKIYHSMFCSKNEMRSVYGLFTGIYSRNSFMLWSMVKNHLLFLWF